MSKPSLCEACGREPDSSSQPSTSRRPDTRVRKSAQAAAAASVTPGVVWSLHSSPRAIPALMDLALLNFINHLSEWPRSPWIVMSEVPALPALVRLWGPLISPSPYLNLDTLSLDKSAGPGDVFAHPICISDVSSPSGDPDQVLSDDDLPPEVWVYVVELPPEDHVDSVSPVPPPVSAWMSACSPPVVSRVRLVNSLDILDAESVFEVSPDTSGFLI